MKNILDIIVLVVLGFVILMHLFKIIYLLFQPKLFDRISTITNKNLSDRQLILYYLITIFALSGYLYSKFIEKVF